MSMRIYFMGLLAWRAILAATPKDLAISMGRELDHMRDTNSRPSSNPPLHKINPLPPSGLGGPRLGDAASSDEATVKEGYSPSKFDPFAVHYFKHDSIAKGYAKSHFSPSNVPKFGNISMLSLNAHINEDTLEDQQRSLLLELIDTHHPTVFGLQNVSKKTLDFLIEHTRDHYDVADTAQMRVDITTKKEEYKPIFYDRDILERVVEGAFEPKLKDQSYATFAEFRKRDDRENFLVINGDLLSSQAGANDTIAFNIISDIRASGGMAQRPVVFLGTVDTMSPRLKSLIEHSKANMIEKDDNNKGLDRDTFHDYGKWRDGVQRDFVLLFDGKERFTLNYARILTLYNTEFFTHYPVYAILTKNPSTKN